MEELNETLLSAAEKGDSTEVTMCLQKGVSIHCTNKLRQTPLHVAAFNGNERVVEVLLNAGSDVSLKDNTENTPLHLASSKGLDRTVKLLLNAGSDVKEKTKTGRTALHWAAEYGYKNTVEVLLRAGSDIMARDNYGKTPLDIAEGSTRQLLQGEMKKLPQPEELLGIGLERTDDFLNIMRQGRYKCFWNRVYLVGPYAVGKSTLAKVLVGEHVSDKRNATDGIWIYMGRAAMDIEENCWEYLPKGNATYEILKKMLMSVELPPDCSNMKEESSSNKLPSIVISQFQRDNNSKEEGSEEMSTPYFQSTEFSQVYKGKEENLEKMSSYNFKSENKLENPLNFKAEEEKPKQMSSNNLLLEDIPEGHTDRFAETKPEINFCNNLQSANKLENPSNLKTEEEKSEEMSGNNLHLADIPDGHRPTDRFADTKPELTENTSKYKQIHEQVVRMVRSGKYNQKQIPIDIWDFGGQKDYYMTHQLFITSRGIFVLMFNGSVDIHKIMDDLSFLPGHFGKPTIAVYLCHWVNSILTYCKRYSNGFPKIVFVATHKDKVGHRMIKRHRKKLVSALDTLFSSHPCKKHLEYDPLLFINAGDKEDAEIKNLRELLMEKAREHPRWGEEMPTAFVPLEIQLSEEVERGMNIISREQIKTLNSQNQTMILSENQLETFLEVQHSLGKLIYFDNDNLRNFIIINPAYLVNVLRSIVTEKQFWPKEKQLRDIFVKMQIEGTIKREDLNQLWNQKEFSEILPTKNYITDMLVHLDVLVNQSSAEGLEPTATPTAEFIVPCMITSPNKTKYLQKFCTRERSITLAYSFSEDIIPPAMVYRFLGSFMTMWKIKLYKERRMLYSDLAVVEVDNNHDIAIRVKKNRIIVSLVHREKKENIVHTLASSVQECLTSAIYNITEFYVALSGDTIASQTPPESDLTLSRKSLQDRIRQLSGPSTTHSMNEVKKPFKIEFGVICHCSRFLFKNTIFKNKKVCFFPFETLPSWSQCQHHGETHDKKYIELWYAEKSAAETCSNSCKGLRDFDLIQAPSEKHIRRLTKRLTPDECRKIFFELGMEKNVWEQLDREYQHTPDFMFLAILRWKEKVYKNATFRQLQSVLEKCELSKHLLCQVFRDIDPDVSGYDKETLNKTPSQKSLLELCNHIGESAIHLGVELGLEMSKIQQIRHRHKYELLDQTKEILSEWRKKNNSTILELIKALHRIEKVNCLQNIRLA